MEHYNFKHAFTEAVSKVLIPVTITLVILADTKLIVVAVVKPIRAAGSQNSTVPEMIEWVKLIPEFSLQKQVCNLRPINHHESPMFQLLLQPKRVSHTYVQ